MSFTRAQKFEKFQRDVVDLLTKNNELLEKINALLISNQLLQECVSPDGEARSATECAEIVSESYMAGMCLAEDLKNRTQEFQYQKSEFFIEAEDEELYEEDEDDEDDDDAPPAPNFTMAW